MGGECDYWACIPSKTLLRPGEALAGGARGARRARGGERRLAPEPAFAWRDFMVSDYDDTAQGRVARAARASSSSAAPARLAGPGSVEVGEEVHTTEHVVIATGSDPVMPPDPRAARARRRVDQPRGHGADGGAAPAAGARRRARGRRDGAGASRASAPRWRSWRAWSTCCRASRSRSARRSARRSPRRGSSCASASTPRPPAATATSSCSSSPSATSCAGDRLLVATGRRPRVEGLGLETVGHRARPSAGSRSTSG